MKYSGGTKDSLLSREFGGTYFRGIDMQDRLWFSNRKGDGVSWLYCFDQDTTLKFNLKELFDFPVGYTLRSIHLRPNSNDLWFRFDKTKLLNKNGFRGIQTIFYQLEITHTIELIGKSEFSFNSNYYYELFFDSKGINTYFSIPGEVFKFDGENWKLAWKIPRKPLLRHMMTVDRQERLIVMQQVDEKGKNWDLLIKSEKELIKRDLKVFNLNNFIIDYENNIWLGTEKGLIRVMGEGFTHYNKRQEKLPDGAWSIIPDENDRYWIGSYGQGLLRRRGNTFDTIKQAKNLFSDMKDYFYMGAMKDSRGRLWFPHTSGIALRDQNEWLKIPTKKAVMALYEDTLTNEVLIGSRGLYKWKNGQTTTFIPKTDMGGKFTYIVAIEKDKKGYYWLGTHHELIKYDGKKKFEVFEKGDKVAAKGAISLHRDHRDNIWIGSHDGLLLYDYQGNPRQVGKNVLNYSINFIEQGNSKYLFLGLYQGLGVLDLEKFYEERELVINIYDRNSGFPGIEAAQNGAIVDHNGHVWVLTSDYLTKIEPERLNPYMSPPKTSIYKLEAASGSETTDEQVWTQTEQTTFTYKENSLRFHFRGIYFSKPDAVKYQFRLRGFDEDWSEITSERQATYYKLPPGNYTFEVKSTNGMGKWSPAIKKEVKIIPAYWQTWWFKIWEIIGGALVLSIIAIAIYVTNRKRREAKEKMENAINGLKLKTLTNQVSPHFAANLITIMQFNILKETRDRAMNLLGNFGQLLQATLMGSDELFIPLDQEIEMVKNYLLLEAARYEGKLKYSIELDETIDFKTLVPKLIVQTYVNNAIKHGLEHKQEDDWYITIQIDRKAEVLRIQVQDNGVGREAAKALKIPGRNMGKGLNILEETFNWLNAYHSTESWHKFTDLYDNKGNPVGTHVEAHLPIHLKLPPSTLHSHA